MGWAELTIPYFPPAPSGLSRFALIEKTNIRKKTMHKPNILIISPLNHLMPYILSDKKIQFNLTGSFQAKSLGPIFSMNDGCHNSFDWING
jgi:hypothetical protein